MEKTLFFVLAVIFTLLPGIYSDTAALYECPSGWEEHIDHCYRFVRDPVRVREEAKTDCAIDGAYLLSIGDDAEHNFVIQMLDDKDAGQIKQNWWTSGRRLDVDSMEFYWEGDGTKVESFFYWHNDSIPADMTREFITYHFDGLKWAWILALNAQEKNPYVCEISKDEIYKISQGDRGPDYGVDNPDPETIERGPKFTDQPEDTIYEPSSQTDYVDIECVADAYPAPAYEWYKFRIGDEIKIDLTNPRYTMINGKLIIHNPSTEEQDDGTYQCGANNKFGYILSNIITLGFGYLQDFPKSPRAPVTAIEYGMASIECNPPAHFPDILYTWYKDDIYNFIRPELKPYIFISHDGRLYFSEVTTDDIGQYFCLVYKPGQMLAEGKVSMPTELKVIEGSPGIYEPEMGSGFPLVYPDSPMIGDTVRLECWASGSSQPPLVYAWDKVEILDDGNKIRIIPLPPQSYLSDHSRVLTIPDAKLYDAGTYRCHVERLNGLSTNETVELNLNAVPYFILPLEDQFADVEAELTWRCEAGGDPAPNYQWLKNGLELSNDTIPDEDRGRIFVSNNVLYFTYLHEERDNGMYQCSGSNMYGTRYSTAELRVLSFAPSFAKYPLSENQLATVKGNTTLICRPEAAPYPLDVYIIWYKNGAPLNPGDEDSGARIIKMRNGNLFISPVQMSDSGVYKCEVENTYGKAATTGNLTVLEETTITLGPQNENILVNHTRFLHCVASYNPQLDLTYVWYQNDMIIDFELVFTLGEDKYEMWYNPHFRRGHGIYNGGLYIMHAQYWHAGRYTCEVESSSGMMSDNADVTISGPPYEPAGVFHDSSTVTTSSAVLQWKESGNNGKPVLSFVIEGFNQWEGYWKILVTNVMPVPDATGTYRHNITKLRPYSTYELRVRAENEIGTSVPSIPSERFTTGNIKPDRYPAEVGGGGGKVGDLVVTWKPLELWEHNGPGIGYLVYIKNRGDDEWDYIETVNGNVGKYVHLVGEDNFYNEYEVAVKPFNNEGEGPMSPVVVIRSAMGLPTAIAQDVRAQPFNATACLVHWEPVTDSKEHLKGKLGGYRLSYWMEYGETEAMAPRVTINGQAEEGLVIGLYPDTSYYFDVMVWNEAGNGPKSQYFIQRTLRNAPIEPPVEVTVTKKNNHAVNVWYRGVSTTNVEEPLEGYKVRLWRDGQHIKFAKDYDAGKETELYIDDLRPDIMYKLRVLGYSRSGDGTMSSPTQKFIIGTANHLKVSWTAIILLFVMNFLYKKLYNT